MGKLVTIATKARFDALREASNISETSLNFILETGLLYTHNIFINGASFGTATSNYIPVKIGGVTKNLSLNGHTHSNYYDNSSDIDIGSNKIKSGTLELLKYSSDTLILGNSSIPTEFFGTLKTTKDGTKYTILDTNNFSIVNKTSTNLTLNNVALFKYGSSSFQLDYVRRYNTVETFNNLAKYTSAGTTNENSKAYGFITLSTDTGTNTYSYAQIRVSIPDNTLEFRTSSDTTWKGTLLGGVYRNITINGTTYSIVTKAGSLPTIIAPTALGTSGQYLTTSDDGKSLTWRTLPTDNNTWRPIAVNGTEKRSSATSSGNLDIINGTNTTVEWTSGNKLKINAVDTWTAFVGASDSVAGTAGYVSAPGKGNQGKFFRGDGTWATPTNTWNAANTTLAGYVPRLTTGGGTISTQASEYVLVYVSSGSGTVAPVWKLLPANAFKNDNTWKAANSSQEGYVPKSTANKILRSDANGALYWGDDSNTWKEVTTSLEGYVPKIVTTGSLAATDSPFILVFKNVSGSTKTAWVPLPANAFKNDNTWTPWAGATASANGTAGYMPAPTSALRGQFLRGDGSWVSLNNYSLPTASNSTLGGVKTGAAITDTTGYTAVAIKDGIIYYKDTNTWNANAVGVAGYVAAPTKAANANMTWLTDAEGVPAWRASNNHSHSYLPLSGGLITDTIIAMDSAGLPTYGGNRVPTYSTAIGKNGIAFGGIDSSSDGAAIYLLNRGSDLNSLIISIGDNYANASVDEIEFRYYNYDGNYYSIGVPHKTGTIALTSDLPTKSSWNYDDRYVSSLTTSGNYLRWVKNGSNNDITIPYATNSSGADHLNFERVSDIHATTGWRFFTLNNHSPSNGPSAQGWAQGVTFLPNNDTGGYRHIITFWGEGTNNDLWIKNQWNGTWGSWRKILDSGNSSVSLSGSTLTVKINNTEKSLTNTWRGIQNNLTSDSTTDSLSAALGKVLNDKFGSYLPLSGGTLAANNTWLSPARLQLLRPDATAYTDRACVGVTDGNLHIDAYPNKGIYLNYYSSGGAIYFNGSTYYIKGGYYNGTAAAANSVTWANVSSKPASATRWPSWSEVTDKPTTFTPSSHEHTYIKSLGDVAPETGRTHTRGGVYTYRPYSNRGDGAPSNYGAVIGFGNGVAGAGEIWIDWCGAGIWYRRLRDCCEDWSGWTKFIDANNIGSQSVSYATSAGSVAWGNITGKPDTFTPSSHTHSYLPLSGGTMVGTISAANDAYGGGGFNNGYANIILRGNTTTGASGIVFSSSKGDTSINRPSDCAFIQFLPYGVSAATAVGTNPTINTSGEAGRFVIGIHNDSGDLLWLQTSAANDLKHVVGANVYTIYDSGNLPAYPTKASWNYDDKYVSSLTTSGNSLRWVKNGSNNDITIPYATSAGSATKATQDNDGTALKGNYLRKVSVANNTKNDFNTFENMTLTGRGDPTTGASLSHAPWTGSGPAGGYGVLTYLWSSYGIQMAWGYNSNHVYIRNKYYSNGAVWDNSWSTVALTSDITWSNVSSKPETATRWPKWTEVTDKPSSFAPSSHDHTRILYIDDRDVVETPTDVAGKNGIEIHFKNKSKSSIPSSGTWTAIVMLDGYSDTSGGYPMELGFSMSDLSKSRPLYLRSPKSATEWGGWRTILDSDNSSVSKSGETLTVKINGTSQSLTNTNTWRSITDSYSGTDSSISLSQKGGKALYDALVNGYASSAGNADTVDGCDASYFWNYKTPSKSSGVWDVNEVKGDTIAAWAYGFSDSTSVIHGPVGDKVNDARAYYTLGGVYCPLQLSWYYTDSASLYARTYYNGSWYSWKKIAFTGDLTWGNVSSKPSSTGSGTQPVYWNGSTFVACTTYANASVNYATSAGSAGSATYVGSFAEGTGDEYRYVWFSWSDNSGRAAYKDSFKFCPNSGTLSVSNISAKTLYLSPDSDVTSSASSGNLIVGNKSGYSIGIDDNEIMARNGSSASTLYLNNEGGQVCIGTGGINSTGTIYQNGTAVSLSGHTHSYLPLSGGTLTGALTVKQYIFGYNYNHAGGNAPSFVFDKPGSNYTGIGANGESDTIYFSAATISNGEASWVTSYKQKWKFNGTIHAAGGNMSGHIYLTGAVANSSTSNTSQIVFGTSSNLHVVISSNTKAIIINPSTGSMTGQTIIGVDTVESVFGSNVKAPNFYTTSDRNKKQNISILSEHIRKFQLKDTEKWHYGVIAQEVEEMFRDGEEGNMTVNYNSVLSYYVGLLENKVASLEKELNNLKQKLK